MGFDVFPDPQTAATLGKPAYAPLALAKGEAMRAFVPLPRRAGPDPAQGGVSTAFVRIAVSGDLNGAPAAPTVELSASDPGVVGFAPRRIDPATANSPTAGVQLYDSVNQTSAAIAYFKGPPQNNVHFLKIVIEIANVQLCMRIGNDIATACDFVWVVADSDEETRQPWLIVHSRDPAAQAQIRIDAYVGQAASLNAEPVVVENRGTGAVTIAGAYPPIPAPFALFGPPLRLPANTITQRGVTVGIDRPASAHPIAETRHRLVTSDNADAGPFGPRHNNVFSLIAQVGFNNQWIPRGPISGVLIAPGAANSRSGDIDVVGGSDTSAQIISNAVKRCVVETDSWHDESPASTARSNLGAACGVDGVIYAIDGLTIVKTGFVTTTTVQNLVEALDPAVDVWTTKSPMPTKRHGFGLAAGRNGRFYAVG